MTSTASPLSPSSRSMRSTPAAAAALISAVVASIGCSVVVAAIAHAAGASHRFKALDPGTYSPLIVIGLLVATIAWITMRTRAVDPGKLMRRLAPAVVAASLIPDLIVGASSSLTGSSWGAVTALMVMHLVVAACGVVSLAYFLPLGRRR